MKKQIPVMDLDQFDGPMPITVHFDTILPEFHMRHVIDLASIVGNHHVAREAYIAEFQSEFLPVLV